eukprot:1910851-Pleurochrysis_carterae.AAC.2
MAVGVFHWQGRAATANRGKWSTFTARDSKLQRGGGARVGGSGYARSLEAMATRAQRRARPCARLRSACARARRRRQQRPCSLPAPRQEPRMAQRRNSARAQVLQPLLKRAQPLPKRAARQPLQRAQTARRQTWLKSARPRRFRQRRMASRGLRQRRM